MTKQASETRMNDRVVPKLCGSDVELGNFIIDTTRRRAEDTSDEAARALLAQVQGRARHAASPPMTWSWNNAAGWYGGRSWGESESGANDTGYRQHAQDYGRKFLPTNGGCVYIDLTHLELCTPECRSAFDHLAASRAMLWIARDAMNRANERMPAGSTIKVLANNSDGHGHSYGSHMNVLVTRECFDNILTRKMHYLQFLASFQVASIVLTGAGKVGSENDARAAKYQISSRADFMETMLSQATTFRRPLVNARDESLAGAMESEERHLARLHVIMFDHALCHTAALLRMGMMQIVLCMIEQEQVPSRFLLDDPVEAIHAWSRDPKLAARSPLVDGRQYTAVELLSAIYERASRFVAAGRAEGLVPDAGRIMSIWGECLDKLRQRDMGYLSSRIDWVAKQYLLERAAAKRGEWELDRMKYLDNLWSSLDANEGLYWVIEKAGAVEKLVTDGDVERLVHQPPEGTRAWLRAWALTHASEAVDDLDWDMLRLRTEKTASHGFSTCDTFYMPDPLGFTREKCQALLEAAPSPAEGLRRLLSPAAHERTYGPKYVTVSRTPANWSLPGPIICRTFPKPS